MELIKIDDVYLLIINFNLPNLIATYSENFIRALFEINNIDKNPDDFFINSREYKDGKLAISIHKKEETN